MHYVIAHYIAHTHTPHPTTAQTLQFMCCVILAIAKYLSENEPINRFVEEYAIAMYAMKKH